MATMILLGGEKDGTEIKVSNSHPDVFYAVPNADESRIKVVRGRLKAELQTQLSVLAYRFDATRSTPTRYVMCRAPELDKARR